MSERMDTLKQAWKNKQQLDVTEMSGQSFLNVKALCQTFVNRKKNESGQKVEWLKIRWMRFQKNSENKMMYKYTVDENEEFMVVDFDKKREEVDQLFFKT